MLSLGGLFAIMSMTEDRTLMFAVADAKCYIEIRLQLQLPFTKVRIKMITNSS